MNPDTGIRLMWESSSEPESPKHVPIPGRRTHRVRGHVAASATWARDTLTAQCHAPLVEIAYGDLDDWRSTPLLVSMAASVGSLAVVDPRVRMLACGARRTRAHLGMRARTAVENARERHVENDP